MSIELLENRIAPAAVFLNSKSASFSDSDGDIVTVSFSKPILTPANVASVISDGPTPAIDLTGLPKDAKGLSPAHLSRISLSVKKGLSGDGFASIASINASGIDLASISGSKVRLGSLSVGDAALDPVTKILSDPTPKTAPLGALNVAAFGLPGAPRWVNAKTATYTDGGGDVVTVSLSKPVLTPGNVASVLVQGGDGGLQKLDLTALGKNAAGTSLAQGANVTVKLKKGTGDGMAPIGFINAQGIDLGVVSAPQSDLGRILVGDGVDAVLADPSGNSAPGIIDATPKSAAIKSLSVASMGTQGLASQGGSGDLASEFYGEVGTLAIKGDVLDASLAIRQSFSKITIGGSLVGHDQVGQGSIQAEIASTQKQLDDALVRDPSQFSGSLSIGGSVVGGSASETGYISAGNGGSFRSVTIGGDLQGGAGSKSGVLLLDNESVIGSLSIKGSINAGSGVDSGAVYCGGTGTLAVGGIVQSGSGALTLTGSDRHATGTIVVGGNLQPNTGTGVLGGALQLGTGTFASGGNAQANPWPFVTGGSV
jgi:hypothetical protein